VRVFFVLPIIICSILFLGCGGSGSDSSLSTVGNASDISVNNLEYLPAGTVISFNPDISVKSDLRPGSEVSAQYFNISSNGNLPRGTGDVNASLKQESNSLIVLFLFESKEIKLTLSDFIDKGGDGTVETFKLNVSVDQIENNLIYDGRFKGNIKPTTKLFTKPVTDTNRAPTVAEFETYLVNKPFFASDDKLPEAQDRFVFGENGQLFLWPSGVASGTYEYVYNNGSPKLKIQGVLPDERSFTSEFAMNFTNFFVGTYEEEVSLIDGVPQDRLGAGTFRYYKASESPPE
jgi:hypothetical protein